MEVISLKNLLSIVVTCSCIISCAQVPESSVTLSQSIGKDIQTMSEAHSRFANAYFDELEKSVNDFIDNVYAPAVIKASIDKDLADSKSEESKGDSAFFWIETAFLKQDTLTPSELEYAQSSALQAMQVFHSTIYEQVEEKRSGLLTSLRKKRQSLLTDLQSNYDNMMRKNAAVSGLLSSVVDVYNTQELVLEEMGVDPKLRTKLGTSLASLSNQVDAFRQKVDNKATTVEDIKAQIDQLQSTLTNSSH